MVTVRSATACWRGGGGGGGGGDGSSTRLSATISTRKINTAGSTVQ